MIIVIVNIIIIIIMSKVTKVIKHAAVNILHVKKMDGCFNAS